MNWTITDLQNFESKVLTEKDNLIGEKITNEYIFAGAGQKCIKLESKNNTKFISYEDVLNEEEGIAKALFDFFFKEEEDNTSSNDSFSVDFKVLWNKNPQVYSEGYINIPAEECEDSDIEWYYYDNQGFTTPHGCIKHDGVDITGATYEQNWEIAQFKDDWMDDSFWIDECICQSDADENRTYVRENCTLIINKGAKMECTIKECPERGDYLVEVIPYFNGKKIDIASHMNYTNEEFDPWNNDLGDSVVEHGHIYFEMSKDYWDEEFKEELIEDVNEEARRIYAMTLTYELGIYAKYGEVMEQALDDVYNDEWLFKMSQMVDKSDEELEAFLIEEGFEFEHQFIKEEDV